MQRAVGQAASLPDSQSKAASVQSSPTQTSSAPSALSSLTPTIDSPAIQSTTAQGGSLIADNSKVALAAMSIPVAVRQQATSPASKDEKLISPDSERSSDAANLHRADSSSFAVQNAAPEKSVSMPVQRDSRSHQQSALSEQAQYSEPSEANRSQPSAGERAPMASASTVQQPNVSSQSQPSAATAYAASAAVEHQTQADRPLAPAQSVDSLQSTAPIKSPAVNGVPIAESLPTATQSDGVSQKADATTSARFEDAAAKLEKLSDVLDQVRSIAVSGEKKADVDVHLEMGRVQIHVEVDGKSVSVNFAADNASLEHALRQRLPELQRSLSENGFSMGNTTFHGQGMAQGQGGGFRENFREPVQQQAAFEESRNPKTSSSQASVATPPDASTIDNGRLYVVA
jgi:flagellar hook-length control protein FliK